MHMSELGDLAVIGEVIGYQKQKVEGRRFVSVEPLKRSAYGATGRRNAEDGGRQASRLRWRCVIRRSPKDCYRSPFLRQ